MPRGSQGSGKLSEQIKRLKTSVGRDGVTAANVILSNYEPDVVKLAFKMMPKGPGVTVGLGVRVENLLSLVPKNRRANMRAELIAAKEKRKQAIA